MNHVYVKLLGIPSVELNRIKITFPYKKSEALFYYVCINKKVSREEATSMFWSDTGEETARKNLRDALYKIKSSIHEDIFSPSKSTIEFSDNFSFEIDTDEIMESNAFDLYSGDFLFNFSVKNCYEFEEWLHEKRDFYKDIYIKSVKNKVIELVNSRDFNSIDKYKNILIKNDPYNEKTYRHLMKIYAMSEDYNKAIKLYHELAHVLKKDLDVEPELKTKKIFKNILDLKDAESLNIDKGYAKLKSKVEDLTEFYTIYHEAYPMLSPDTSICADFQNIADIESELKNIDTDLTRIDNLDTEYLKIKMEASYLAGRYYVSVGKYEQGVKNIGISIKLSQKLDNLLYLLNNYKQMIYYAIQTDNNDMMREYIEKCLNLLDKKDIIEERGIVLRLKGLYLIKNGNYEEAANALNNSISIFSSLNKFSGKHSINISASYNYLGQMHKDLGNTNEAYNYFIKAIQTCIENSVVKGLEIFYSNAGQSLYHLEKYGEAEEYINKSLEFFNKFGAIWGRDMTECYKALLEIKKNNYNEAEKHLKMAYELAKKLNHPKALDLCKHISRILQK